VYAKNNRNLLERAKVTNNCLLRKKYNTLNLLEREGTWKKKSRIYWWIKI